MSISLDRVPLVAANSEPLRVLIVTESFLPQVNGVTNSVRRVLEHLAIDGHTVEVVAPTGPTEYAGFPVTRTRGATFWVYKDFRVGLETRRKLRAVMRRFSPDVIHVASPALLGRQAVLVAKELGIPSVAIYQTDLVGFWDKYKAVGGPQAAAMLTRQAHSAADRTLAPSSSALTQLEGLGVQRTGLWPRGVDVELFHPSRIDHDLRAQLAPNGETIVGYVGRLAQEKELHLLAPLAHNPAYKVVLVGGGPQERELRHLLPNATFMGVLQGEELGARTPPSTCSRTPALTRRSARRSRRLSPPGSRSSRHARAGRWTWSPTASPGSSTSPAAATTSALTSRCSTTTRSCGCGWGARPARASRTSPGAR